LLAGALAFVVMRSGAASPPLWTEGSQAARSAATSWVEVAKADTPAVVNISATQAAKEPPASGEDEDDEEAQPDDQAEELMRRFFGEVPREFSRRGLGSGFIIRSDGYVVTNNPMVERPPGSRSSCRTVGNSRPRWWGVTTRAT
jgi:S1-C subfamily serine protease